jgi:hypothetical protein
MSQKRIDQLDELTTPQNTDLLAMRNQAESKSVKVTRENFFKGSAIPADTVDEQAIQDDSLSTDKYKDGSVTPNKLATGAVTNEVTSSQTTTSTSYTDLSTVGPSITLDVPSTGMVLIAFGCNLGNTTAGQWSSMSIELSGANTASPTPFSKYSILQRATTANAEETRYVTLLLTGLSAGSTTFTAKYRVGGNTGSFRERNLSVVPLG